MIKNLLSIILTIIGFLYFLISKKTPNIFYQSYVRAYCFTNGYISFVLSKLISLIEKKKSETKKISKIFTLDKSDFEQIQISLKTDGYYVFEQKLNEDFLIQINNFVKKNECTFFNDNGEKHRGKYSDEIKNLSSKFSYDESKIYSLDEIKKLIYDPAIINICQEYFNSNAYLSNLDMWWTPVREKTNINIEIANRSAQYFHFDLDRIKWLKFFVYLTDTFIEDGPHEYIKGTHGYKNKNQNILNKGYQRIKEDELYKIYETSRITKLIGKKGTIFIGDTSCFHRGFPPVRNDRLLLVLEYSNSMFGGSYNKIISNEKLNYITSLDTKNKIIFK